jgi:CBS domain-containing protein
MENWFFQHDHKVAPGPTWTLTNFGQEINCFASPARYLLKKDYLMKTCEDVMTPKPVCCLPTDNVLFVAELMKSEDIGAIPVIENMETQKLIGIITDRDLALRVVAQGLDTNSTRVESVMTRKVVTCRSDDDLQRAVDAMAEKQLRRIVIVDNANKVLGVISQADVATRVNQPVKTAEMVKEISQPTEAK